MHRLWRGAPAEARRLLRVLFLRLGTVSADSGRAYGRDRPRFLLCGVIPRGKRYGPKLTRLATQTVRQPVGVVLPQAAILAALFVPVPVRTVVWIIALLWMGTACILNAR